MVTAIVGINWGDEGKGRMVDLLSAKYDIVCRYQGGNNAGHTVINERGSFILNLIPSGIFRPETVNVMGGGMVIDLEHLTKEIAALKEKGVEITPKNLVISDRATICMPYHKRLDILEEQRLADKKYGSTQRGIAPVYSDKYLKKTLRMGDLRNMKTVKSKLADLLEWKNLTITKVYGSEASELEDMYNWLETYGVPFLDYVQDTTQFLTNSIKNGKSVMFEAQLGALRDIDFGIYPYTSSSSTISAYAPIGAGIPGQKLDSVVGIMKAYSSCVGEGPFTCEMFGDEAEELRKAGGEYGAATGRPRRVGGFDVVASRYGVMIQGATEIALTKLDVLSYMKEIPVCVAYKVGDKVVDYFPTGDDLASATPVYEKVPGWNCDISKCRSFADLPKAAQDYVNLIEEKTNCKITYVSVGADRNEYFEK
ncbi:MAG: adenylosuccinate synthase [Treponemataceae bacterium]|nr:adenylosuccinate synthase [Treponemataceae bacterium]